MTSINNKYHKYLICFALIGVMTFSYSQRDTERFRMQFAVGVNNPIDNGENDGYFSKTLNLPTVNSFLARLVIFSLEMYTIFLLISLVITYHGPPPNLKPDR